MIDLVADPTSVAFQSRDKKPLSFSKLLPAETHEILYLDEPAGRIALRFETPKAAAAWKANKASGLEEFPVFVPEQGGPPIWAYDEVIVRFRSGDTYVGLQDLEAQGFQFLDQTEYIPGIVQLRIPPTLGVDAFEQARRLLKNPDLEWAEPNFFGGATLLFTPNDPLFVNQFHHQFIQSGEAWDTTIGSSEVKVAILDEGIDVDHPDLAASIWRNPSEESGVPGVDDDGNGYIDDLNGWDFTGNGDADVSPITDAIGAHGTAVGGLVAAVQNNSLGVSGIAPGVRLISCRHWNGNAIAEEMKTVKAVEYAAAHADILNLSWGGSSAPAGSFLDALDFSLINGRGGKGCVVIAASGNSVDTDSITYPGRYAWLFSVGESGPVDLREKFSGFGDDLGIIAPSGSWTTDIAGVGGIDDIPGEPDYTSIFVGTSGCAPQVCAVAALILSNQPGLSGQEVIQRIINSADNSLSSIVAYDVYGKSPTMGYGRINVARAVAFGAGVVDDRLEPNDFAGDAAVIKTGYYPHLLAGPTPDYYKLGGTAGAPIFAEVPYFGDKGEVAVHLLDSNLVQVATATASSYPLTPAKSLTFFPPSDGTYFLKIVSIAGGEVPYQLRLRVGAADDGQEPNNSSITATTLFPGTGTSYRNLVLNDEDWYKVFVGQSEHIYGLLSFNHSEGDIDIEVFNPQGGRIEVSERNWFGDQFTPAQPFEEGDYTIRVYSNSGDRNREYSLHLSVLAQDPLESGQEDVFAGNGQFTTAQELSEGFYPNLALTNQPPSNTPVDYFRTTIPAGKRARLTVGWTVLGVDLDVYAFDNTAPAANAELKPALSRSLRRTGTRVESVTLPEASEDRVVWFVVARSTEGSQFFTGYKMALEFLDTDPEPATAFWRLIEGNPGALYDGLSIRDWRGPRFSHAPRGFAGLRWTPGPNSTSFPGGDGIALDCSAGGFYYTDDGFNGELAPDASRPATFWARIKPINNNSERVIAGYPGVWEFAIGSDNHLALTVHSGPSNQTYQGPAINPTMWQEAAFVWDPSMNQVRILGSGAMGLVETSETLGLSFSGSASLIIGSSSGGGRPLGLIEQARYFARPLATEELQGFSSTFTMSDQKNWALYY